MGRQVKNKVPRMQDRQNKTRKKQQIKQSEKALWQRGILSTFDCISEEEKRMWGEEVYIEIIAVIIYFDA